MNIVCFYEKEWEKEYLEKQLSTDKITFLSGTVQDHPSVSDNNAEILCVFVNSCIGKEELKRFKNVKLITTRSTGFCHIKTEELKSKKITVCNVPSYGQNTVAEYAFALLLNVSRKICLAYSKVKSDCFAREDLQGFDLKGKTIGVIGTGAIGAYVCQIAEGFGMKILAFDLKENPDVKKIKNAKYTSFEQLLKNSDIITLHAPHNKHTHHMINKKNIKNLKKGACLINTARGGLVQTEALVQAPEDGIILGAGLDVLEEETSLEEKYETQLILEPNPDIKNIRITLANHYLIDHPNVIITPHNAFNSREALERILEITVNNIKGFKKGKTSNVVCGN